MEDKVKFRAGSFRCQRCGHTWLTRMKEGSPISCPKCHSYNWNKPRKDETAKAK